MTNPRRATDAGAMIPPIIVTNIGNTILLSLVTGFSAGGIFIARSFFVVIAIMTGGWMRGTRAM